MWENYLDGHFGYLWVYLLCCNILFMFGASKQPHKSSLRTQRFCVQQKEKICINLEKQVCGSMNEQ